MKILIACEYSGIVRDAFVKKGHDAMSCDLLNSSSPGKHYKGDVFELLKYENFDMLIGFPPCTYLSKVQLWRCNKDISRKLLQLQAINFFKNLLNCEIEKIALENPVGILSKAVRSYDQLIHPYMFGSPYQKEICLWLKNLPLLLPTKLSPGRKSMYNHVNSRMSQAEKSHIKSKFFPEIAEAMANQWG